MYYVYILKSKMLAPRYYVGATANLPKRIMQHNRGQVRSTKAYIPWSLVHMEEYKDKKSALQRELFLKNNYRAKQDVIQKLGPIV